MSELSPNFDRSDPLRRGLTAATLLTHLAVADRYDFFRDELYFIICGRHPSFGYVDQPPLVPLISAFTQLFGEHLFLLRAVPALAAAATVYTTITLARLLGAGRMGELFAGIASSIAPMFLGLQTTLGTTTFEPFLWVLLGYLVIESTINNQPRLWLWIGLVIGIDLEIKYELPIYLVPLIASVVLSGNWRTLLRWQFAAAIGIACAIAAPSALWQLTHGLPFLEVLHNQAAGGKNVVLAPLAFVGEQIKVMNPLFAPIWIAGVVAPFVPSLIEIKGPRFRAARILSLAFAVTFTTMLLLHAKDYFLAPLYGSMFAVGGVALEIWIRKSSLRAIYLAAAISLSAIAAPMAMPILSPTALVAYLRALHLQPQAAETLKQGELPQTFADMFGWRELTAKITEAVHLLPPDEQARVVILAHNYGEAAALDFYGRELPPVITGHNQYFLWGQRGTNSTELIAFNRDVKEVKEKLGCDEARELNHFFAAWVVPFEDDSPITLCKGVHPDWRELWPELKLYY